LGLLLLQLLTASGDFHQTQHRDGKATSPTCVLCLLANGHVDLPEVAPSITPAVRPLLDSAPRYESVAMADFSYLASPSRAPPAFSSPLSVVA
jgi:hypothetical protein